MAQAQQPRGEGDAEFVRRIVTDPRNVPDVMRLYGYLGASSEENHERLYLSPDLSTYIEVPRDAILHRTAVPAEQDPHGATTLWVRRDAALIYKTAPAAQALAQYFAGAIAGAAAAGGGAAAMPAGPLPLSPGCTIAPAACPVTLPQAGCPFTLPPAACPTRQLTPCPPCPTHQLTPCAPCPTRQLTPCAPCPTRPPHATCFVLCTQVTPCTPACPTRVGSCAPACLTNAVVSCAVICTQPALCRPTFNDPACPFPTEVPALCTHLPVCGVSGGVFCGPQQSIACGSIACGSIGCMPGGGFGGGM